ncbi:MAG: protein translocase subunit SecF, partial [Minisyncoccia bacterium]
IGTDFTGGSLIEVRYANDLPASEAGRPAPEALSAALTGAGLESVTVRGAGENSYIVRAAPLSAEARTALPNALVGGTVEKLSDIGPSIGSELRSKALIAVALVALCIVLYIAFVFRKVSEPVSSWWYGLITVVTLIHDIIVPLAAFAVFGYLWGAQVDTLFVTAILTVLGYSVHDTIVVFDRTRENLRLNQEANRKEDFELVAGRSVEQTFVRSVNTSMTTLIALGALFFLGPVATQDFALTLIIGIVAGTYSSIALATPLLVSVAKWQGKA